MLDNIIQAIIADVEQSFRKISTTRRYGWRPSFSLMCGGGLEEITSDHKNNVTVPKIFSLLLIPFFSVFENKVLRTLSGAKRDEITREWRRLHNELHAWHSSPNIIKNLKWRRLRRTGHVARMKQSRNAYRDVDGRIILKWI